MSDLPAGKFVWYELMTTDPDAAVPFYKEVLGWGTETWQGPSEGMPPYKMWMVGEGPIGGVMELPEQARAAGAPPHWLAYVAVEDADSIVAKAKGLGATVHVPPQDIPEVGRFAVLADPSGAVFALLQPSGDAPGHDGQPKVGEFSWHELMADNHAEALEFYQELFGWEKHDTMDMGEAGIYQLFGRGGVPAGGMMNKPPEMPMGAWNVYARVTDVDEAASRVSAGGGTVLHGPMEVPGGDRVAVCQDPQGAVFSIHQVNAEA